MASRTLSSLQNDAQTKVTYRGPFTWLTVFGVLFCILEYKHFTDNHFCLRRSNGPLYDAPDKCYAGDLQSFGATLNASHGLQIWFPRTLWTSIFPCRKA